MPWREAEVLRRRNGSVGRVLFIGFAEAVAHCFLGRVFGHRDVGLRAEMVRVLVMSLAGGRCRQ